jgi:ABC-type uncharacterized transport system involved in gliding motility auxiliary subunit
LEPDKVRRAFTGRQARYGSNIVVMSIAFLGILFVVNWFVYNNPQNWDMTEGKTNTLAPETIQALESLPEPVKAVAFYSSLSTETATELLDKFKANSNGNFDYQFINPDTDPIAAREAGITGDGKILLVMGERQEIANFASETELTKTLIKLINPEARAVYFLTGHGEASLESGNVSFSTAKSTLESKNYTVNSLNLLAENKIPEDALAIIIGGPVKQVSEYEVQLLKQYVDAGGSLVVMEDPTLLTEFGDSPDPLAEYLTADWGITLDNDVVIDLVNTQNPLQAVSSNIGIHPITQNLTQNYIVILPQARSLSIAAQPIENVTQTPIILTTEQSWGETELKSGTQPEFTPEKDVPGPLNLAIAGENATTKGRVVVFGNSLFATNDGFDAFGNGNMFINSVDWAAEQEDLISITPREPTLRTYIPPNNIAFLIMIITTVLVLPGLVVFAGVSAWLARRKRG